MTSCGRALALWATFATALLIAPGSTWAAKKKHAPAITARGRATPQRAAKSPPTAAATGATTRSAVLPTPKADVGERLPSRADGEVVGSPQSSETTAGADASAAPAGAKSTKTKVYTFGAMDVEGKLKTPQLLYFLNRVKLELEMSAPDQRSFMKELARTADDPNL